MVTEMPHSATQMGKIFRARKTMPLRITVNVETQTGRICKYIAYFKNLL